MDVIASLPTSIGESMQPTMEAYAPLLLDRGEQIKSTKRETFTYGSHERQTLDVYYPTRKREQSSNTTHVEPVLIFIYGGGFVSGSKQLELADGLAYANIGHFFAEKLGYTTVIPDYRLLSHGARFPSGGEDVALVLDWIRETLTRKDGYSSIDLFIMGNSAGGVHLATYAFAQEFADSRGKVLSLDSESAVRLRGMILLSVPFNFKYSHPPYTEILHGYYGKDTFASSPQGLLKAALTQAPKHVPTNVRTMILNGELEPNDDILQPRRDFIDEWRGCDEESFKNLALAEIPGHNHISLSLSLGTGISREEAWGYQVGDFINSLRS